MNTIPSRNNEDNPVTAHDNSTPSVDLSQPEKNRIGTTNKRPPLKQKLVPVARRCVGNNSGK